MKRMPSAVHGKGAVVHRRAPPPEDETSAEKGRSQEGAEPRSVLDRHRSPSHSSTSTSADVAAVSDSKWPPSGKEEWELQPIINPPAAAGAANAMDDEWDSMLSDHPSPFLRWITADPQAPPQQHHQQMQMLSLPDLDPSLLLESVGGASDSIATTSLDPLITSPSFPFPPPPSAMFFPEPNFLLPFQQQIFLPTSQVHSPGKDKPHADAADESSAAVEQLVKAAQLLEAGNAMNAHGILARLNQLSPHHQQPLVRSAFYFKEALLSRDASPQPPGTPWDVVLKLSAYKAFSEASPLPQFTHFTCVQALLEELGGFDRIHVVDFDVGVGGQWSSFLQELSQRRCPNAAVSLKITAFVTPSSHHPLELALVQDNLAQFAAELGIAFEFNALNVDSFELAVLNLSSAGDEAIAVNLPAGSCCTSGPQLLRLVKQLSPKIVVSTDHGCERSELPFSQHLLHSLRSYSMLIDSIDAANANLDVSTKIGKFLLQPRIENSISGRYCGGYKMLPWRTLFASAGFLPLEFSNFTETQAECLLKRTPARGFHVEKRQSSMVLFWQQEELVSVSAWRCC